MSSFLKLNSFDASNINIADIKYSGKDASGIFIKDPSSESLFDKFDVINVRLDPSLNVAKFNSNPSTYKEGFTYSTNYTGVPGLTKTATAIEANNVSINSDGSVLSLKTGFNQGVGVRGFSKSFSETSAPNN